MGGAASFAVQLRTLKFITSHPEASSDTIPKRISSLSVRSATRRSIQNDLGILARRAGEALHPEREPLEVLNHLREAQGEYNFAGWTSSCGAAFLLGDASSERLPKPDPWAARISSSWQSRRDGHKL
jgi:hypothetical protein